MEGIRRRSDVVNSCEGRTKNDFRKREKNTHTHTKRKRNDHPARKVFLPFFFILLFVENFFVIPFFFSSSSSSLLLGRCLSDLPPALVDSDPGRFCCVKNPRKVDTLCTVDRFHWFSSIDFLRFGTPCPFVLTASLRHTGFNRVEPGFTRFFYWVLPGSTGFYRVLPGFTGYYWVWLGFARLHRVLPVFTGFYRVLLGFCWVLKVFTGFC